MHNNSKTQQIIATNSAETELCVISSTISDAIRLKQLITEIADNIDIKTFDLTSFCFAILLQQLTWFNEWGSTNKIYPISLFVDSGCASSTQFVLCRISTENNPTDAFTKTFPTAHFQRHISAVDFQTDVANEVGNTTKFPCG